MLCTDHVDMIIRSSQTSMTRHNYLLFCRHTSLMFATGTRAPRKLTGHLFVIDLLATHISLVDIIPPPNVPSIILIPRYVLHPRLPHHKLRVYSQRD
jgi:hypothetical protein